MPRHRLYYKIKPYLPWSLRNALRRASARQIRRSSSKVWPIDPSSSTPPPGWDGWPEEKKFAFVVTHDVEGPSGLANCRKLAEFEMASGIRSSFNFIPEGGYHTPPELRSWLTANGFEVGVHDLFHDGELFRSRRQFLKYSQRINQYLKEWKATGFRSGFMLHKLEWIHDLDIQYDTSTFDTDPFEPQPEGMGTIFPFWVRAPENFSMRRGYVELPYTLPQDSTLYLILRETTPEIWIRKLDWVAEHGGMALVNVHPDYMRFDGDQASPRTYPIALYGQLIDYVRNRYGNSFWQPLPSEVSHYIQHQPPAIAQTNDAAAEPSTHPIHLHSSVGRVLMLVENSYPSDTRVRNEANMLVSAGYEVSVISLGGPGVPRFEMVAGVRVFRFPRLELFKKTVGSPSRIGRLFLKLKTFCGYATEYLYFTGSCFLLSSYVFIRYGFDVIHAHNPPDTLFIVAAPFRLFGKKFVFDHHDLCPELYMSRYKAGETFATRILRLTELCTLKLADVTIATNDSYKGVQVDRGGRNPSTIFVVRNGPDATRMTMVSPSQRLRSMNKRILVYIGCLNPQDGVDYLLRSLSHLLHDLNRSDFYCVIMGKGDSLDDLRQLAGALRLDGFVELTGFVPDEDLWSNLAAADICVDPDPSSPLNDVSTWIKIMEYMAYAKPIVSFDLKETRYSAQDAALYVPCNDELAFAGAIATLMDDGPLRERMGLFGRKRVEADLQWSVVGRNLLAAYDSLALNT